MSMTKRESFLPAHLAKYPTPFHVYYENRLKEDAEALKRGLTIALPQARLFYSTKTNSLLPLLRCLLRMGWGLETVCAGDRRQASLAGARGDQILLNGAAWTRSELEDALVGQRVQRITVDSLEMARLLGSVLRDHRGNLPSVTVGFRVHDGNSHFGFSREEELRIAVQEVGAEKIGLHLHVNPAGSVTSAAEVAEDFRARARTLLRWAEKISVISFLDFGGGFDSPYVYRPHPAELARFHDPRQASALRAQHAEPRFTLEEMGAEVSRAIREVLGNREYEILFEPGRAVCSRALSTVLEVRAVKENFYPEGDAVITDGNTALLGPLHRGIYPVSAEISGKNSTFLYGNLPHSADWLFQAVPLPKLSSGDRLLVSHTGAYFLPLEANFGLARPGIYFAEKDEIARTPETEIDPGIRDSV